MKSFKIKVEKEEKIEFIYWVIENYKGNVPKTLKGPYFFFDGNKISQSTKYFFFKYKKLPKYTWSKSLKKPIPYEGRVIMVDLKDHEIESYPSFGNYSNLRKDLDKARVAAVKLNNELKQLDGSIKKYPKINVGNHQNKTMKKQTKSFSIDLSKVDRLEVENLIKSVGGVFYEGLMYDECCYFLTFCFAANKFWYRKYTTLDPITSIQELKKQLGIDEEEKTKEYVLKEDVTVNIYANDYSSTYAKGTVVDKSYRINGVDYFTELAKSAIFHEKHVEEKKPLLSDVVKFGDELELCFLEKLSDYMEYWYLFAGKSYDNKSVMIYDTKSKLTSSFGVNEFNQQFKLKK